MSTKTQPDASLQLNPKELESRGSALDRAIFLRTLTSDQDNPPFPASNLGRALKHRNTALHVADVFFGDLAIRNPKLLSLGRQHTTAPPFEVHVAVIKGLRHLYFKRLALEQAQERSHWNGFLGIRDGREVVPEQAPFLFQDVP